MLPKELSYHRRFGGGQLGSHLTKCGVTLGKKLVSQQLDAVETSVVTTLLVNHFEISVNVVDLIAPHLGNTMTTINPRKTKAAKNLTTTLKVIGHDI